MLAHSSSSFSSLHCALEVYNADNDAASTTTTMMMKIMMFFSLPVIFSFLRSLPLFLSFFSPPFTPFSFLALAFFLRLAFSLYFFCCLLLSPSIQEYEKLSPVHLRVRRRRRCFFNSWINRRFICWLRKSSNWGFRRVIHSCSCFSADKVEVNQVWNQNDTL